MTSLLDVLANESKWLAASMLVSFLNVGLLLLREWRGPLSRKQVCLWALNQLFACTIGMMGLGHLIGVAIAHSRGTLEGSLVLLYPLGLALAVPAWLLFGLSGGYVRSLEERGNRLIASNLWVGLTLLAAGPHNFPLALPALINVVYQRHRRPIVGRLVIGVAVASNVMLFAGAVAFFRSGQTFEELRGL